MLTTKHNKYIICFIFLCCFYVRESERERERERNLSRSVVIVNSERVSWREQKMMKSKPVKLTRAALIFFRDLLQRRPLPPLLKHPSFTAPGRGRGNPISPSPAQLRNTCLAPRVEKEGQVGLDVGAGDISSVHLSTEVPLLICKLYILYFPLFGGVLDNNDI